MGSPTEFGISPASLELRMLQKGLDQCNRATSDSRLTTHDSPSTIHHPPSATAKPCIEYQIGKCNGLCIQAVSYEEYRRRIDLVMDFFKGNREPLAKKKHASSWRAGRGRQEI